MQVSGETMRRGWIRYLCLILNLIVAGFILYFWFIVPYSEFSAAEVGPILLGTMPIFLYAAAHVLYFSMIPRGPHRSLYVVLLNADILGYLIVCALLFVYVTLCKSSNILDDDGVIGSGVFAIFITVNLLGIMAMRREFFRLSDQDRCPNCHYYLIEGRDMGCPECGWNRPEGEGKE